MTPLLLLTGCMSLVRLTLAPPVDTAGAMGVDVRVSGSPYFLDFGLGGSYIGAKGVGAVQTQVGLVAYHPLSDPLRVRGGIGYSGRFLGALPDCPWTLGTSPVGWNGIMGCLCDRGAHSQVRELDLVRPEAISWSRADWGVPDLDWTMRDYEPRYVLALSGNETSKD